MSNISYTEPDTFEFQPELDEFEGAFGESEGDLEADLYENEESFGEFEAPSAQKNWYYFDAWWRPSSAGRTSALIKIATPCLRVRLSMREAVLTTSPMTVYSRFSREPTTPATTFPL